MRIPCMLVRACCYELVQPGSWDPCFCAFVVRSLLSHETKHLLQREAVLTTLRFHPSALYHVVVNTQWTNRSQVQTFLSYLQVWELDRTYAQSLLLLGSTVANSNVITRVQS